MQKILFIIIAFLAFGSALAAQNNFFEPVQVKDLTQLGGDADNGKKNGYLSTE